MSDAAPRDVAVTARTLAPFAAAVDEALDDPRFPCEGPPGRPLRADPHVGDLLALLRVAADGGWLMPVTAREELNAWPVDPFPTLKDDFFGPGQESSFLTYGLLDELEQQALIDNCNVPLALVCWTTGGVKWVDMWAVRRRLTAAVTDRRFPL